MATDLLDREPAAAPPAPSYRVAAACGMLDRMARGERVALEPVTWDEYDAVAEYRDATRRRTKVTFNRGRLEIMTRSFLHEKYLAALAGLVAALSSELGIARRNLRELTLQRRDLDRGIEPDGSYYLGANARRMLGRDSLDFETDPPPDLALESEYSRTIEDRLEIYAAFGIREIWCVDADRLRVLVLKAGRYEERTASRFFPPFPFDTAFELMARYGGILDDEWDAAARAWVRETFPNLPTP